MSFRMRTMLRLFLSLLAGAVLTGLALSTMPADAQDYPPLFVNTGAHVYAVDPFDKRITALDLPGVPLNMHLSPDGAHLLVDAQAEQPANSRVFFLVDTHTLAVTEPPLAYGGIDIGGMPYWRWDSKALLYSGKLPEHRASVYHYQLEFDRTEVWATDIPVWGDGGEGLSIPPVVWWDEEGFALLQHNLSSSADLLPYTRAGRALEPIRIYDADERPDLPFYMPAFSAMLPADVGMHSPQLAVYRPEIDKWDIVYPLSGDIERIEAGETVTVQPAGWYGPRYALIQQTGARYPLNQNVAVLNEINGRRMIFGEGQGVMALSPRGSHYTLADFTGFYVTDGETRIRLDIPAEGTSLLSWQVVWAPLVGTADLVGSFRVEEDALILHTATGDDNIGVAAHYALAPDNSAIVWVTVGPNNEAQIWRYVWETGGKVLLYTGPENERPAALPRIVRYDGAQIALVDDLGALFVTNSGTFSRPEPTVQASKALFQGAVLSPDFSKYIIVRYVSAATPQSELLVFDALKLDTTVIYTLVGEGYIVAPSWSRDGSALMWTEYSPGIGARLMRYDFESGDLIEVSHEIPVTGDAGEVSVASLVWWDETGYVLRHSRLDGRVLVIGYAMDGSRRFDLLVADYNFPAVCQPDRVEGVNTGGQEAIGVYYPANGTWRIIDPLTGDAYWLPEQQIVSSIHGFAGGTNYPLYARPEADTDCEPGIFPEVTGTQG